MLTQYPDPIEPAVTVSDFLHLQSYELETKTVAWASGTDSAPSNRTLRWVIPPVGLISRIDVNVDGGSLTAYNFTAGGGAGAAAANGEGPFGLVENVALRINGGVNLFDVSGFGTYLIEAAEGPTSFPTTAAPGEVDGTVSEWVMTYDPTADSWPAWGISVPLSLTPGQPLGMILAGNDQTTIELVLTLDTLSKFAALTGGATATLSLDFTPNVEYFAVPEQAAFEAYVRPLLGWAHQNREWRQDITSVGDQAITLDNHDTILQLIHRAIINGAVDKYAVERLRFVLNRSDYRYNQSPGVHFRRQRRAIGKDIPAYLWPFFSGHSLRDAIRADAYTDIRSILSIRSGTNLGSVSYFMTTEKRLIQLDARPGV